MLLFVWSLVSVRQFQPHLLTYLPTDSAENNTWLKGEWKENLKKKNDEEGKEITEGGSGTSSWVPPVCVE